MLKGKESVSKGASLNPRPGESHTVLTDVKLGVVDSNEDISQDPERTGSRREVNSLEATQTKCLTFHRLLCM